MVVEDEYLYEPVKLDTEKGEVLCRYYSTHSQYPLSVAVIYVTRVGGDWGAPAFELYPRLCDSLARMGIDGLPVRYRYPTDLIESVFDTLGVALLKEKQGKKQLALWAIHLVALLLSRQRWQLQV